MTSSFNFRSYNVSPLPILISPLWSFLLSSQVVKDNTNINNKMNYFFIVYLPLDCHNIQIILNYILSVIRDNPKNKGRIKYNYFN